MKRSYGDNPKIHYGIDKIQCMMPTLRSPPLPDAAVSAQEFAGI
jgi:hypothetical protein